MEPIVNQLNQVATQKLKKNVEPLTSEVSPFQNILDQSLTDRLLETMQEQMSSETKNEMTVLSAENIHLEVSHPEELSLAGEQNNLSDKFFNLFKEVNQDMLSLDSAIEALTTPGVKFKPSQILALQAGVSNATIMAEGFTKAVDGVARAIQSTLSIQT